MRATVKYFHSPDIADLSNYKPDRADCFAFLLQIIVGPENSDGEESFDVTVVTPLWLIENHNKEDIVIGRHYLVVFRYDFSALANFISSYISQNIGETWDEIACYLSRLGKWEFEDYVS